MTLAEELEDFLESTEGQTFDLQAFCSEHETTLAEARELLEDALDISAVDDDRLVYPRLQTKTKLMMAAQGLQARGGAPDSEALQAIDLGGLVLREYHCSSCDREYWRPAGEEGVSCVRCGTELTGPDSYRVYRWDDERLDFMERLE